jgi:hypothetical protein
MQEKMVFAGQHDNYGRANEVIEVMLDRQVSAMQVHRVSQAYGKDFSLPEQAVRSLTPPVAEEVIYAQVDGGMILTREKENNWKEVKVGRLFKSKDCVEESTNRGCLLQSQYVAHLGEKEPFCKTMDELLDDYGGSHLKERLVFISDGAVWIHNWSKDMFPKAVHILDYYHANEHLYDFVKQQFKDDTQGKLWGKQQEALLLDSKTDQVIEAINQLEPANAEAKKGKQDLIGYYTANLERMDYARYKKIGAGIIGSGAIESTHRTLVQKRLKQSGQRWTRKGAQNVLNLRVVHMNGNWNKIIDCIKNAALIANFKKAA